MPQYSFENNLFFSIWGGGQHTTPSDPGLPKPPCHTASVATKIENGPKTNTKILRFLKMDRRRIRRIFVNSKILRRSSKIANSSNIFEDTKIFKGK